MSPLVELLMIEDNPSDIRLTQEYFKEYKIPNRLRVVTNNTEALRLLRRQGEYTSETIPDILLLGSRMLLHGDDWLIQQIRDEAARQQIVLVVLTASEGEATLLRHVLPNSLYIPKPLNLHGLTVLVQHLDDFWFSISVDQLPKPATTA